MRVFFILIMLFFCKANCIEFDLDVGGLTEETVAGQVLHSYEEEDTREALRVSGPDTDDGNTRERLRDSREAGNRKFVLSLDGGGIKGLLQAEALVTLEDRLKENFGEGVRIGDKFDFISGTSIGGILSLAYLKKDEEGNRLSALEVRDFLLNQKDSIFPSGNHIDEDAEFVDIMPGSWFGRLYRSFLRRARGVGNFVEEKVKFWKNAHLTVSKYDHEPLEAALRNFFGERTLNHIDKPVLITSVNRESDEPFYFRNFGIGGDISREIPANDNFYLRDVCRATSAAPTYFRAAEIENLSRTQTFSLTDGGTSFNNPSALAVANAIQYFDRHPNDPVVSRHNICLLSLGTGDTTEGPTLGPDMGRVFTMDSETPGLGLNNVTVKRLMDSLFVHNSRTVHAEVERHLDRGHYFRINPPLSGDIQLDSTSDDNIRAITSAATDLTVRAPLFQFAELIRRYDA